MNKRLHKKILRKQSLTMKKVSVSEKDVIVIKLDYHVSNSVIDDIQKTVEKYFPGNKVLVLSKGANINVLEVKENE